MELKRNAKELRNKCTRRQINNSVRHSHEMIDEQLTSVDTDNCRGQIDDYDYDDQGQQCESSIERISNNGSDGDTDAQIYDGESCLDTR